MADQVCPARLRSPKWFWDYIRVASATVFAGSPVLGTPGGSALGCVSAVVERRVLVQALRAGQFQ